MVAFTQLMKGIEDLESERRLVYFYSETMRTHSLNGDVSAAQTAQGNRQHAKNDKYKFTFVIFRSDIGRMASDKW